MAIATIVCWIILLTFGTGCCDSFSDKADGINLTRRFAMEMAIRKNIDLRFESLNFVMAEIDVVRSRGIYDPVFNATANGGISFVPGDPFFLSKNLTSSVGLTQYLPTGGSVAATTQTGFTTAETDLSDRSTTRWQSSVGISLSQPLLKNAGKEIMEFSITLAASTLQDSMERFRSANADTVLSVINSYNRLYTLRQVLETRIASLGSAQNLLDEINKREKPGPLQGLETANAEYALAQRRRDLVEAERNSRDQEAGLRYLIGMDTKNQIIPIDPPSRDELQETEEQAIQAALELRADLRGLRLTLKTTELQERIAKHQTLPDLFLTASGGFSGTGDGFENSFQQIGEHPSRFWSAGMQLNVPIGNTTAESDYRKSKIRTEQVKTQIESLAWKIRNEVEADLRALISARLQIQITDKSLQFAGQRLEEYRKNNLIGTATIQDVLNSENDLTSARNAQLDASETFAYAVARLWKDMGVLLDRQGIHLKRERSGKLTKDTEPD